MVRDREKAFIFDGHNEKKMNTMTDKKADLASLCTGSYGKSEKILLPYCNSLLTPEKMHKTIFAVKTDEHFCRELNLMGISAGWL